MKINKFKILLIAVFCVTFSLCYQSLCCDEYPIKKEHAFDYSPKGVCDDKFSISSKSNLGVRSFIEDCLKRDEDIRKSTKGKKGIEAIKVKTGFITDDGVKLILNRFKDTDFLRDLRVLDLSCNRAATEIFNIDNLCALLSREVFEFFDVRNSHMATIEQKTFVGLDISQLEKIIWISEASVASLSWVKFVGDKGSDAIRRIKSKHYRYFKLNIDYTDEFSIILSDQEPMHSLEISDWSNFLNTLLVIEDLKDSLEFKYLKEFALDDEDIDERDKSRLEIAKLIQRHESSKDRMSEFAEKILYTLANDKKVSRKIHTEAVGYLEDIEKNEEPLHNIITDRDVDDVINKFQDSDAFYRVYEEFNETSYFDNIYKRFSDNYKEGGEKIFQGKEFSSLSDEDYRKIVKILNLFDVPVRENILEREYQTRKQIFNMLFWAKLAGCPFLVVSEGYPFFYETLHIYTPDYAKTVREQESSYACFPYEKKSTVVGVKKSNDKDNITYRTKEITNDLKNNAVIYRCLNQDKTNIDMQYYQQNFQKNYFDPPKISYDFLQDYIVSPYEIDYMREVLRAFSTLSKSIVNLMRGKAIYLSPQDGTSLSLSQTSHNAPVITYLGFMPGIFIEHNPAIDDRGVSMTCRNIIYILGILLWEDNFEPIKDIKIFTPSPFQDSSVLLELREEKENLFDKRECVEKRYHLKKCCQGYMTKQSESSSVADFAEHFVYYALFRDFFWGTAKAESHINDLLLRKFKFMEKLFNLR